MEARRPRVMVVDDSAFMRKVISSTISKKGIENIIEAEKGEDAVRHYALQRPELVIMDLNLPGMSGLSALREIKKIDPSAKILVLSANSQRWTIYKAKEGGASAYLSKPFIPEELWRTVLGLLGHMKEPIAVEQVTCGTSAVKT